MSNTNDIQYITITNSNCMPWTRKWRRYPSSYYVFLCELHNWFSLWRPILNDNTIITFITPCLYVLSPILSLLLS